MHIWTIIQCRFAFKHLLPQSVANAGQTILEVAVHWPETNQSQIFDGPAKNRVTSQYASAVIGIKQTHSDRHLICRIKNQGSLEYTPNRQCR